MNRIASFAAVVFAVATANATGVIQTDCYWHWMNGNVSKEGITADLEYMKASGIEAAMIFDVGIGAERGVARGGRGALSGASCARRPGLSATQVSGKGDASAPCLQPGRQPRAG